MYGPLHSFAAICAQVIALLVGESKQKDIINASAWYKAGMHPSSWGILHKQRKEIEKLERLHASERSKHLMTTTSEVEKSAATAGKQNGAAGDETYLSGDDDELKNLNRPHPAWVLSNEDKLLIDEILECIIYPTGLDEGKRPLKVFSNNL